VYDLAPDRQQVIEHGAIIDPVPELRRPDPRLVLDEPLRLAFVGLGWAKKGLDLVNQLADDLVDTSIEVHHFGELHGQASPNLRLHGRYDNARLPNLLDRAGIQIVLLPGPYAETFGHVMTEALIAGRPVVGARYGALGQRIRDLGVGWTIDPDDAPGLTDLIRRLDQGRLEVLRATRAAASVPIHLVAESAHRYADLYRAPKGGAAGAPPRRGRANVSEQEDRLRRELRATTAVNRQLLAQLESSGDRAGAATYRDAGLRAWLRTSAKRSWPWVRRQLPTPVAERLQRLGRRLL
jgi:hypothetical protein